MRPASPWPRALNKPVAPGSPATRLRRVGVAEPVLFAGGVAHNPCVKALMEEHLGLTVIVPNQPDMVGALGAALHGERNRRKKPGRDLPGPVSP